MTTQTPHERAWTLAQRLPLELCFCLCHDGREAGEYYHAESECVCNSPGQARGKLHDALRMALTVPHNHKDGCPACNPGFTVYPAQEQCKGTGRVVRPMPGEMPCTCHDGKLMARDAQWHDCPICGGSGTVPGTDEASVVAQDEAMGRLWRVERNLFNGNELELQDALLEGDYPGACEAVIEALTALVPE